MLVRGIGLICAQGAGVGALEAALRRPFEPPASFEADLAAAPDRALLKKIRRADKFSKMVVVAARGAIADAGVDVATGGSLGIIVATSNGPHVTAFGFLDEILQYGDANVSPTKFSNSVHNASAGYVAETVGADCVTLSITGFYHSFHRGLEIARAWLREERCARVLVGAVEQYGELLRHVCDRKLTSAAGRRIQPFSFAAPVQCPGEGAAFFLLEPPGGAGGYCEIGEKGDGGCDLAILDADGLLPNEEGYLRQVAAGTELAAYSPLFGSMMTGTALNCAVGALMIRNQERFASPVADGAGDLNICREARSAPVRRIRCIRLGCRDEVDEVVLKKCQ